MFGGAAKCNVSAWRYHARALAAIAIVSLLAAIAILSAGGGDPLAAELATTSDARLAPSENGLAGTTNATAGGESSAGDITTVKDPASLNDRALPAIAQVFDVHGSGPDVANGAAPARQPTRTAESVDRVPALASADLSLAMTAERDPVLSDSFLTYTMTVTNAGPADAVDVVVTNGLPGYMSFLTMSGCFLANATFPECHLNKIPAGESRTFEIEVMSSPGSAGPSVHSATVGSATADPEIANNSAEFGGVVNTRSGPGGPVPPVPTATSTPTVTPQPTATAAPTATVTPTPTVTPALVATATVTPTPTVTSGPVATATPTPTVTPTATVTPAPLPSRLRLRTNINGADSSFGFTGDLGPFTLTTASGFASEVFSEIEPGTYVVTLDDPAPGYRLNGLGCTQPDGELDLDVPARTVTIDVGPGETLSCDFDITETSTIILEVQTLPAGDPQQFDFSDFLSGSIADGETLVFDGLLAGVTFRSTQQVPAGWTLSDITCDSPNTASSIATAAVRINVTPGETVRCVFTNIRSEGVAD